VIHLLAHHCSDRRLEPDRTQQEGADDPGDEQPVLHSRGAAIAVPSPVEGHLAMVAPIRIPLPARSDRLGSGRLRWRLSALAAKVDVKTRVKDAKDSAVEKLPPSVRAQSRTILLVSGGVVLVAVGWMFKRSRNA
jgi:hypothetical protein